MDTVNNLASAASKAIWGEQPEKETPETAKTGDEPVSGATGDVKSGEPYDAGNLDSTSTEQTSGATNPSSDTTASTTDSKPITTTTNTLPSPPPLTDRPADSHEATAIRPYDDSKGEEAGAQAGKDEAKSAQLKDDGTPLETRTGPTPLEKEATAAAATSGATDVGTQDSHIQSSGVTGAAKPADPIPEQKAASYTAPTPSAKHDAKEGSPDSKGDKPSLKEKVKAKLHIHGKSDKN